jgi:flagellar biosynthesis chaperone FliJ
MTTTYKIVEQEQVSADENRNIEISEPTVNKSTITVAQIKREAENIDNQIKALEARKEELKAQVTKIKTDLSLDVEDIV